VDGEQLAKSPASVINRLTPVGVECFLAQLLEIGYFHADPHPGNLLVTPQGKLALIDFGLCAKVNGKAHSTLFHLKLLQAIHLKVPLPDTRVITAALVHLMQGDVRGLILDAIELGFLPRYTYYSVHCIKLMLKVSFFLFLSVTSTSTDSILTFKEYTTMESPWKRPRDNIR
jgi:serine/threonine protein kinase